MKLNDPRRMVHCHSIDPLYCKFPECNCALNYEPIKKQIDKTTPWGGCPNCNSRWNPTFMVHDELWKESGMEGWPCILCFEKAIGRKLKIEDLKPSPLCNHLLNVGWFLGNRPFGTLPTS